MSVDTTITTSAEISIGGQKRRLWIRSQGGVAGLVLEVEEADGKSTLPLGVNALDLFEAIEIHRRNRKE